MQADFSKRDGRLLTPRQRLTEILELVEDDEVVSVSDLSQRFLVSAVTIRNDLADLERQGLVARVRGGARAVQRRQSELAFDVRVRVQAAEKRAIARAAAAMITSGDAIALDCSSTSYYLALELRRGRELVVVTNGLRIAAALAGAPNVSVIVLGGILRDSGMSTVGQHVIDGLSDIHIDKGFFGVCGLNLQHGFMELNPEETRVKRELVGACAEVFGIFDHTKWSRSALLSFAPVESVSGILTDSEAPPEPVAEWQMRGVPVTIAGATGPGMAETGAEFQESPDKNDVDFPTGKPGARPEPLP